MADQILPLNQDIKLVVHEIGDLLASSGAMLPDR